jgi:hypothetical protein
MYDQQMPQTSAMAQYGELGQRVPDPSGLQPPTRKYFSRAITNTTSELPLSVIKELKGGLKNYIPLALCTHKACSNAMRYTNPFDTEIGWTDKGEMKLKQKSMMAAKDHYLTTDDFTEARENFVQGYEDTWLWVTWIMRLALAKLMRRNALTCLRNFSVSSLPGPTTPRTGLHIEATLSRRTLHG